MWLKNDRSLPAAITSLGLGDGLSAPGRGDGPESLERDLSLAPQSMAAHVYVRWELSAKTPATNIGQYHVHAV